MKETPYAIPAEGSLGLLALGHEGLDRWRAVRGDAWVDERRRATEAARGPSTPEVSLAGIQIVVVTGLPRSGTSMAMQMLAAAGIPPFTDGNREADENNQKGYFEHERVKAIATDREWIPDANGHAVKVVAPLAVHLPPGPTYHVVLMERDIEDILASQSAMLGRSGKASMDAAVLRPAYRRFLEATSAWAKSTPGVRLARVSYADAVRDPAAAVEAIVSALPVRLALDRAAMAAVVDPALRREGSRTA